MDSALLVDFRSHAKGITLYVSAARFGQHFRCYLEPRKRLDSNCVALMLLSGHQNCARETAQFLAG